MRRVLEGCAVRSFRPEDAVDVARHADNRKVWLNLRDRMPHPYSESDARAFLAAVAEEEPERTFAIEVDGCAAGAIGFSPGDDVERCGCEVGYWLGEPFWGRGVASRVVAEMTPWAIEAYGLTRVFALPFADNTPSRRVLEKAGYTLEGIMRRSAIKDGVVKDQCLYAFVPERGDRSAGFLEPQRP